MELVKLNAQDFDIQESKAKEIAQQFKPMLDKMEALEQEFNEVISLSIEDPQSAIKAKELRSKYVKVRTGTSEIHKEQKAFYLAGGRYVDGWKNAQIFASQGKEEKLMAIEKHQEIIEKERLRVLQEHRVKELSLYVEDASERDLASMENDVWVAYLSTKKKSFEDEQEAIKQAEIDRLKKEEEERKEQARIVEENAKLKAEAIERERLAKIESDRLAKIENDRKVKEEADKKEREAKEAKIKADHEAQLKKERQEREKSEAEAKAKQAKLEAEIKLKEEAEAKAKREAEIAQEAELTKGDSDKVKDLINDLELLKSKYSFKSAKNKKMYSDVGLLIDKVIHHIN